MRARHGIISLFGLGLVATIACSRNANQANFIGQACKVEADCPAELLCVNDRCWEPCAPDGSCKNPGEVCILGACQPGGGSAGDVDGSTGGQQGTDGGDFGGGSRGDGILAREKLPNEGDIQPGFDVDDQGICWLQKVPDGFGNTSIEVHAASLSTTSAPEQKLHTVAPTTGMIGAIACANGYAYWLELPTGPGNGTLSRKKMDGSGNVETIVAIAAEAGPEGTGIGHVGDDLFVVDGAKTLRRYDTKTTTLDPISYGSATSGKLASRDGNTIYWLYDASNPPATPMQVWSAQVGSPGASTGVSLPKAGGGPGYVAFGASGTTVLLALSVTPKGSLTRADATAAPSGNPQQVYAVALEGGFPSMPPVAFSGAFAFVEDYSMGGATAQVMRVDMLDGSKTQIGTAVAPGSARPVLATATTVYWLEPSSDGQSSNLMKKPRQ